jgi:ferric-dicitrate binding protein FerR (iron transport regulator)
LASAAAAAVVAAGAGHFLIHKADNQTAGVVPPPAAATTQETRVVGHPVAGAASVVAEGAAAPLEEGKTLVPGSRVVAAKTARVLLAFSTGTSAVVEEGGDVTLDSLGSTPQLRLDSGSIDLHVAKQGPSQQLVVRTLDAEVDVQGTQFRVAVVPSDAACGAGTTTRVTVADGAVLVRHAGVETRVSAGEQWPSGCGSGASAQSSVAPSSAVAVAHAAPTPSTVSTLGEQNDMFAKAIAAKRRGDTGSALAGFDRFLSRYPGSPLAESAAVERLRLLRASDPSRAAAAARSYLARYPKGFAHAEAEAIVAGSP